MAHYRDMMEIVATEVDEAGLLAASGCSQFSRPTDCEQSAQKSGQIAETHWLLFEQAGQSSLPTPFFVIVVAWLVIIFLSLGLFTPRNATAIVILLLCALSAAGALYLIQELDRPFGGLISISSAPLRNALAHNGR